jgi:hemerythrin-like domain-containing protein
MPSRLQRRRVIQCGTGLLVASATGLFAAKADEKSESIYEAVSPPEDLMREHGVLNRVLLIYEAGLERFARGDDFDVGALSRAAKIVQEFIEGYHERNEEQHLFPRFRKAGKLQDLVDVLYQQHQAGRRLTDNILSLVPESRRPGDDRARLVTNLQAFIRMYRPHEAREDTELFPQIREIVSAHEFDAMAEDFEKDERRHFGEDGFEAMVHRVVDIERTLGINDLRQFTPS